MKNARRRKVKIVQVCCPYCGNIDLIAWTRSIKEFAELRCCSKCGRCSTSDGIFLQVSSLIRMQEVHRTGYSALKEKYEEEDLKIIGYDIFHMELIELTCILEVTLRSFYFNLIFLKYKNTRDEYLSLILGKNVNNDFMNIAKANNHYKKGLGVDLKEIISQDSWDKLIDLCQIRNTIVHNNGMIDDKFRKTPSFERVKECVSGNLIFIDEKMIGEYFKHVLEVVSKIEMFFNLMYKEQFPSLLATYYFNLEG